MLDSPIPILAYHFVLPMLVSSIPILAYHFCFTNVGFLHTNIGILFLIYQCWISPYQYWHIIFDLPMLDSLIPIMAYHFCFTNVGIYNTLPILVSHLLVPKINQIYTNKNHKISPHWNCYFFLVLKQRFHPAIKNLLQLPFFQDFILIFHTFSGSG